MFAGTVNIAARLEIIYHSINVLPKSIRRELTFKAALSATILVVRTKAFRRHWDPAFVTFNAHSTDHQASLFIWVDYDTV